MGVVDAEPSSRWPSRVVVGATALMIVLVLFDLDSRSLWYDEGFSIGTVDRPFGDALWRITHWELNQSPFLLLLAGWLRLGDGDFFLRLLPAASSALSVPAIFVLGRRVAGPSAGAVAAVILALHPLTLQWGQQLRGYSLATLLTIVATTLLLRAVDDPEDRRRAMAYGVVAAVATYAHFFAGFVVVAHALWLMARRPMPRRLLITAGATYGVAIVPLVEYFLTRRGDPLNWVQGDDVRGIVRDTALGLTGGTTASAIVYAVAFVVAAAVVLRRQGGDGVRSPTGLMVLCAVLPPALVTMSTVTVKPLLEARFLIVIVPALVVVVAAGVTHLPRMAGAAVFTAVAVVSVVGLVRWYTGDPQQDWRTATALAAEIDADADVAFDPWGGVFAFRHYEDQQDLEPRRVARPGPSAPAASDVVVEIRTEDDDARLAPDPSAVEWYERHGYELGEVRRVDGLTIRVHRRA